MAKANAAKTRPSANFAGLEGLRLPSFTQTAAKTGAISTTKTGSTDWYQLEGKWYPKKSRRVSRSARSVRLVEACSNDIQKIIAKRNRIKMTPTRRASARFN